MTTAWIRPYDESGVVAGPRFADLPPSLPALFAGLAEREPDAEALAGPDGARLSYRELFERSARVAGGLAEHGVRPGDRVAIRLGNETGWCLAFLGAALAGAIAVPVNTRFTDAEAEYVVNDCGAVYTVEPGGALPDGAPLVLDPGPDDVAALFYTSGTTGAPKGAMLSHRAILSAAESARRALELPYGDVRNLVPAPLFHVMGSLVQWLPTCLAAGTTVLQRSFDAGEWLRAITTERITVLTAVPAMYWLALQRPEFARTDVSGVRRVGYGAAPTPPDQVRRLTEAFPAAKLCPGYGLTETCGVVSGLPHEYTVTHADTVGFAMPATEFKLSDDDELLVRGPQLMSGYWGRKEATERALADGWLHTGDIARITGDGAIQLLDRRTDVVNRGGENVYCTEVENALAAHPAVGEVAVVGVPDPALGKKVAAAVVLRGEATAAELVRFARERIADFKVPQYLDLRSEPLPRNAGGKVVKPRLRDETDWGAPLW